MNKPSTAVAVATDMTSEELTALLQEAGWAEKPSSDSLPRVKLDANTLSTPDGNMYVYNPAKPSVPAATVRIVKPPEEYNAIWIDDEVARQFGRSDLAGTFSKKFFQPDADRQVWPSDEAYDELRTRNDIIDAKGEPIKPSWKADMQIQFFPESGLLTGDEQVYVLTLSTTSLIEFKGTSRAPDEGSVSDVNFIRKLALFALKTADQKNQRTAVLDAMTGLSIGHVAADVRILRGENKELGRSWPVISFEPIHIEPLDEESQLLEAGEAA